jgi:hypothetical protein
MHLRMPIRVNAAYLASPIGAARRIFFHKIKSFSRDRPFPGCLSTLPAGAPVLRGCAVAGSSCTLPFARPKIFPTARSPRFGRGHHCRSGRCQPFSAAKNWCARRAGEFSAPRTSPARRAGRFSAPQNCRARRADEGAAPPNVSARGAGQSAAAKNTFARRAGHLFAPKICLE